MEEPSRTLVPMGRWENPRGRRISCSLIIVLPGPSILPPVVRRGPTIFGRVSAVSRRHRGLKAVEAAARVNHDPSMPDTTPSSPRPVALVTGAGGRTVNIGAAVARGLAETGWDIAFTYWRPYDGEKPWGAEPDAATALGNDLGDLGARHTAVEADLTDPGASSPSPATTSSATSPTAPAKAPWTASPSPPPTSSPISASAPTSSIPARSTPGG